MFFKNLMLYRLAEPIKITFDELNERLKEHTYAPCPRSEAFSVGWVSPYGLEHENFVHTIKGYFLFAFCKEEKVLPASVIREELDKKIAILEQREQRTVYRKEKIALREEVILNLRYQAFSRKKVTYAYIDNQMDILIIDTGSRNKAEEICSYLRKSIGTLKLALPVTKSRPEIIMTTWLTKKHQPASFKIENNCDMLDPKQKTAMIKCKDQDLNADEIVRHLHSGKQIVKLALNWDNKLTFELNDELCIKKIKFLDLIQKQRQDVKQQKEQDKIDTDFAIMSGEFAKFLPDLWSLFDGLDAIES